MAIRAPVTAMVSGASANTRRENVGSASECAHALAGEQPLRRKPAAAIVCPDRLAHAQSLGGLERAGFNEPKSWRRHAPPRR